MFAALLSPSLLARRLRAMPSLLARGVVLARTAGLRAERREIRAFQRALQEDPDLRAFMEGACEALPSFFASRLRRRLGRRLEALPAGALIPWRPSLNAAVPETIV